MQALLDVVLPVFLLIGFGYVARAVGWVSDQLVDNVLTFAQNFAVPLLLFAGIAQIDLSQSLDLPMLGAFYTGALVAGLTTLLGARYIFGRVGPDVVAIGFVGLFSNSLLLGVPLTERAYGTQALTGNYMIISFHAPLLLGLGIALMEIVKAQGAQMSVRSTLRKIAQSALRNPLIIGIACGWTVNLLGLRLPDVAWEAVVMMNKAAIPTALFGLGGVLYRYRPDGDLRLVAWAVSCSLMLHPLITFGLGQHVFELSQSALRSATMTAAVAPGVNTFLFANMYGVGKRVAATSVLFGTAACIVTIWVWLHVLP